MISDSTKKCANCGKEFPFYEKVCPYCNSEHVAVQHERHIFITIWLWFNCIIYILQLLPSIVNIAMGGNALIHTIFMATTIANIVGIARLLRWKKSGFYIIVISYLVIITFSVSSLIFILALIFSLFSLIILYAILNIKKNGISYWKAMDMK